VPHDLSSALLQTERCAPPDRAAALLRLARLFTTGNHPEAERLLDRGLALVAQLPEHDRRAIAPQAVCLAACVVPDRAFALRGATESADAPDKFLIDMARHGYADTAVDYLSGWSEQGAFPYGAATDILRLAKDDDARRGILRSALRATGQSVDVDWHELRSLFVLLKFHWRLLPHGEARDEVRRLVRLIRAKPDDLRGSIRIGGPRGTVTFSSQGSSLLFELLGPLRRFDPELADVAIREESELARAAERYPDGLDTDSGQPSSRPSAEALEQWKRDWTGFALGYGFFKIEDEKNGDFKSSFEHALRSYARDADPARPNPYPRECWPSAEDFRVILYAAGRYDGETGARLLDRIPDGVLRLFAEIEFAAGIAGLPQIGSITREQLRGH
jgi:hypothetical protein